MSEIIQLIVVIVAVIFFSIVSILLPIAYFDGSAKSHYLKMNRNLDVPWHVATFLPESIYTETTVNLNVKEKK